MSAHILILFTNIVARNCAMFRTESAKNLYRQTRDVIELEDGTKITFGYVSQNFSGQQFDLIIPSEFLDKDYEKYFVEHLAHRLKR